MPFVVGFLLTAITFLFFYTIWFLLFEWLIHISMTKDYCKEALVINFKQFLELYKKANMKKSLCYKESLFSNKSELHAHLIKFDNNYYTMKPLTYYKFYKFKKEELKKDLQTIIF